MQRKSVLAKADMKDTATSYKNKAEGDVGLV